MARVSTTRIFESGCGKAVVSLRSASGGGVEQPIRVPLAVSPSINLDISQLPPNRPNYPNMKNIPLPKLPNMCPPGCYSLFIQYA